LPIRRPIYKPLHQNRFRRFPSRPLHAPPPLPLRPPPLFPCFIDDRRLPLSPGFIRSCRSIDEMCAHIINVRSTRRRGAVRRRLLAALSPSLLALRCGLSPFPPMAPIDAPLPVPPTESALFPPPPQPIGATSPHSASVSL
jgi:hypothetical protein